MRPPVTSIRSRYLTRVAAVALLAGLAAGCSSDTSRFSFNPFSNPFKSQPERTASIPRSTTYHSQSLAPAGTAPAIRPISAQLLPPIGSVGSVPATRSPQPAYSYAQPPRSTLTTGSLAASPRISGFSRNGWSAEGGTVVVARQGDTVEGLSNRYGVPADAIRSVNGISGSYLEPGQQITIPVYSLRNATVAAPKPTPKPTLKPTLKPEPKSEPKSEPAPKPTPVALAPKPAIPRPPALVSLPPARNPALADTGGVHVVHPGETLTSIAQAYGTTRPKLAKANEIDEWMSVKIGQKLKVPRNGSTVAETEAPPAAVKTVETVSIDPKEAKPATRPAKLAKAHPAVEDDQADETASLPETPAKPAKAAAAAEDTSDAPQFRWPVKGRVIQSFGQNSDGINISVPEGTEVKAAENGVVAYAGNELKGYGNLVLIRHADGFVTAYAHAKDLVVKRGDTVRRGQTIATAGQTGNVNSPQLLFELRKGATPVDPRRFLSATAL
jgi:murein DD-endopeptidase MepM/ murein hydrolase activator NlpD